MRFTATRGKKKWNICHMPGDILEGKFLMEPMQTWIPEENIVVWEWHLEAVDGSGETHWTECTSLEHAFLEAGEKAWCFVREMEL